MTDDEKENPFSNWSLYTATPWEMFERRKKHRLFERHGVCSYRAQRGNIGITTPQKIDVPRPLRLSKRGL
jgi:hypothetical protein